MDPKCRCGSTMKKLIEDHTLSAMQDGEPIVVPKLEFWECPDCGTQRFPHEAYDRINEALANATSIKL